MDPIPVLPPPEERKAILAAHAHRFPELFYFDVTGDGGADLRLPILLGIPSGASRVPEGQRVSDAWARMVAATFKIGSADDRALVDDCVLWPGHVEWSSIVQRWPALPVAVGNALNEKMGYRLARFETPGKDEVPPALVVDAQRRNSSIVWRRFKPEGAVEIDLALIPPDQTVWKMFDKSMRDPKTNAAERVLDMATACVAASSMPIGELFARWCGLPVIVVGAVSSLAGIAAEYERGEF